jgi:EAL domain-containing protein (putative c-di-GMP-specific phosphodiesterase class I)
LVADEPAPASEAVRAGEAVRGAGALAPLTALGVPLSLDHFGTGYSSLARLRRLPVSEIKIDTSFITRLLDGPGNELIVRSLVDLARALGIRSVAEGVASPDVAAALTAMGCDAAQGPSYCGPLDPAAATAWLADHLRPAVIKARGRGGTHPPRARRPGGRRRPSPAPPAGAVDW